MTRILFFSTNPRKSLYKLESIFKPIWLYPLNKGGADSMNTKTPFFMRAEKCGFVVFDHFFSK